MGAGSTKEEQDQFERCRAQAKRAHNDVDDKDNAIKMAQDKLLTTLDVKKRKDQEFIDRMNKDVAADRAKNEVMLHDLREQHLAEAASEREAHERYAETELESRFHLNHEVSEMTAQLERSRLQREEQELERQYVIGEAEARKLIESEAQRAAEMHAEVQGAEAELSALRRALQADSRSTHAIEQELSAAKRLQSEGEAAQGAQVKARFAECRTLQDSLLDKEASTSESQRQLTETTYTVGQRDQELRIKDSELSQVRECLAGMQGQMDSVNSELQEQCARVERVEEALELSWEQGEKVEQMRTMLQESHGALARMRGALEQERGGHERAAQGLRQQKLRTELLLQLLHHFKERTTGLAPSAAFLSDTLIHSEGAVSANHGNE